MTPEKQEHLFKLAEAYYDNLIFDDSGEYGSVGTHCKRPFGNSDVEIDILEIIGVKPHCETCGYSEEQLNYARSLYVDCLIPYLAQCWDEFKTLAGK